MLDKRYVLPPEYQIFERDEKFLVFDPRSFVWFVTDHLGKTAFEGLARDGNPEGAGSELSKLLNENTDSDSITNYVSKFTDHLLSIGFLHEGEYKEIKWAPNLASRPTLMYIHLTSRCNLKCPYCYNQEQRFQLIQLSRKKQEKQHDYEASTEDFLKLIDEAANLGFKMVKLTGGEALLNKDALVIAERAKSHGIGVNLLTNATLITKEIAERIAKSVDSVSVSLDSAHAHEHDAVRGKGTHAKVVEAIQVLKDAGVKWIHLNSVATPVNMNTVGEFLDYAWNTLNAKQVTIASAGMNVEDPTCRWGAEQYMINTEQARVIYEQERDFYQIKRESEGTPPVPHWALRKTHCGVGNGLISVESNGDVYPCQTMHQSQFLCGNVFRDGLDNILENSGILKKMKNLQVDVLPECNVCPMRYLCAGGCRKEAHSHEGDVTARNRLMCPIYFDQALDQLWDAATLPVQKMHEVSEAYHQTHQNCH